MTNDAPLRARRQTFDERLQSRGVSRLTFARFAALMRRQDYRLVCAVRLAGGSLEEAGRTIRRSRERAQQIESRALQMVASIQAGESRWLSEFEDVGG